MTIGAIIIASPKDQVNAYRLLETIRDRVDVAFVDTTAGGAARARNHGFQAMHTDVIWFFDGDLAAIEGDLRAPERDAVAAYWIPTEWAIAPGADTGWTRLSVWGTRKWGRMFGFCWGPTFALRRSAFTGLAARGVFDVTAIWEDAVFSAHLIRRKVPYACVPVRPVLGRATTPPWPYLLPGDHASSRFKRNDARLNTTEPMYEGGH